MEPKYLKSDLVRQKKMDNKFGGGVFSLNYMANRLNASLGRWFESIPGQ